MKLYDLFERKDIDPLKLSLAIGYSRTHIYGILNHKHGAGAKFIRALAAIKIEDVLREPQFGPQYKLFICKKCLKTMREEEYNCEKES